MADSVLSILVVDDDPGIQSLYADMLQSLGHRVACCSTGEEAVDKVKEQEFQVLLLDLCLPQMDGMQVLQKVKAQHPGLAVVLISGSLSIQDTVDAMRHGAFHCLTKPIVFKDLERCVNEASCGTVIHKEISCAGLPNCSLVVASPAMRRVSTMIQKVSRSPASTVLLLGETGSGKEVVARYLHHLSDRRDRNFVAVNCAAIPESLIESELFGHERGAFTDAKSHKIGLFEEAHKGTLFLDEIGELPLAMQSKLLRALQERVIRRVGGSRDLPLEVRVIAATNQDLRQEVAEGRFREDLFYRLQVIPLIVPPLRERTEDIVPLADYFLKQFGREFGRPPLSLTEEDRQALTSYHWPGNVRELRNCIERSVLLDLGQIRPLPQMAPPSAPSKKAINSRTFAEPLEQEFSSQVVLTLDDPSLANAERELILKIMAKVHGNKNQAAQLLGINRTTLYRKLTSYGVECPEEGVLTGAEPGLA